MQKKLKDTGFIFKSLFRVEGTLVTLYNKALEVVIGKKSALTSFRIDKRGESPEIENELGKNYLQCGSAHRYMIIVSPNQKEAGLIHEEFSFDHLLMDFLYEHYLPGIEVITRSDAIYGKIEPDVLAFHSIEDMLCLTKVSIRLKTVSDFIVKASELKKLVKALEDNPELLIENNSSAVKRIHALVKDVGDVRNYNLSKLFVTRKIRDYYSRLFNGSLVFRNVHTSILARAKKLKLLLPSITRLERYPETVVIYGDDSQKPESQARIHFIPLSDTQKVLEFLIECGYAEYSYPLLEKRLARIEDLALLDSGFNVASLNYEKRQIAISDSKVKMPETWHKLIDIKRKIGLGHPLETILASLKGEIKAILMKPLENHPSFAMVSSLLTKLWPANYEEMVRFNLRDLEKLYEVSSLNAQNYILQTINHSKTEV